MKLISMLGLATFLLGTEAKCKDLHRHARVVLQPWNEDNCIHKAYREEHRMKHDHCETFDPARSFNLQYQSKKHDQISDPSNCNIVVFDEANCHGSNMTVPLNEAFTSCNNIEFTDPSGNQPRHAGRSAKWHCAAAAKVGKGTNSTETVTVIEPSPVVVVPTVPAPVVTVTPSVPVVVVTQTREPTTLPASTSTVVVAPSTRTVMLTPGTSTLTLTKTSAAGSTTKTFTLTLVTTATQSWETIVV